MVLTFFIWNSAPYDTIGKRETVDVSITDTAEKKDIGEVIQPYKIHFNLEDRVAGTTDEEQIDFVVNYLKQWRISNPIVEDKDFNVEKLNQMMRKMNHTVLYFPDDVPLPVYESVLNIDNPNVPEISFDYLIIEWDWAAAAIDLHFISRDNETHYTSTAKIAEQQELKHEWLDTVDTYSTYIEVDPEGPQFIVVPAEEVQLLQNTYFPNEKDEINPTRFRSALFSDPNAVRKGADNNNWEYFQDNHALMSIDTEKKQLKFVHPTLESRELAIPSELLEETIDFINEHGGWTDEYRFSSMDFRTRYVKFKLYVRGVPVLGGNTVTEIEQVWGDEAIYQYNRPYYKLGDTLPSEMETVTLPSGKDIVDILKASKDIDFSTVEEIIPAYYMKQDNELGIFVLEPSWYYKRNGKWIHFTTEQVGGTSDGLE